MLDVIIIGGSYAGLSAGMSLGRALRNVLIIDSGEPCNQAAQFAHNFITHDGENPREIAAKAKEQVLKYSTVKFLEGRVIEASKKDQGFEIKVEGGEKFLAKKLLFATGVKDIMPDLPGFSECWGITIFHCPYCHGYEVKNEKAGILADGKKDFEFCRLINNWTKELIFFTNGKTDLTEEERAKLKSHNILIVEGKIKCIEQNKGQIENVVIEGGEKYNISAFYTNPEFKQSCDLPEKLNCKLNELGLIKVDRLQRTTVSGIFAAGDNAIEGRAVSLATAMGAVAGMHINKELIAEEF
jgi:thioredoxin reductase